MDRTVVNIYNPPIFCGIGTGQHLYIEAHPYGAETLDASLTLALGNDVVKRKWNIRVTQVRAMLRINQSRLKIKAFERLSVEKTGALLISARNITLEWPEQ